MRFHLDEHVDHAIAHGLRLRGIDVTTTTDANLVSADDESHLRFALAEQRVIVTFDRDFLRLAHSGYEHAGIIFAEANRISIGDAIRYLELMHGCLSLADMKNRVEFI